MSSISVSRSTLDRHVLNDGRVSMTIDVEDGFSSITLHLDGGESIEFSRSLLSTVAGICQAGLKLLWQEYPGVAPELQNEPQTALRDYPSLDPAPPPIVPPRPQERPQINVPAGYGEPAPKPQAREGLPATEKQVGFIDNLGQANHLELDQLIDEANRFTGTTLLETWEDVMGMDRKAASELIEHLKAMLESRKAAEGVPS